MKQSKILGLLIVLMTTQLSFGSSSADWKELVHIVLSDPKAGSAPLDSSSSSDDTVASASKGLSSKKQLLSWGEEDYGRNYALNLRCVPGITYEEVMLFPPFKDWLEYTCKTIVEDSLWRAGELGVTVRHFVRGKDSKIKSLKCTAHIIDRRTERPLPGVFELRENSKALFLLLEVDSGTKEEPKTYVTLIKEPHVATGTVVTGMPRILSEGKGNVSGRFIKELQKCGITLTPAMLIDMNLIDRITDMEGKYAFSRGGCYPRLDFSSERVSCQVAKTEITASQLRSLKERSGSFHLVELNELLQSSHPYPDPMLSIAVNLYRATNLADLHRILMSARTRSDYRRLRQTRAHQGISVEALTSAVQTQLDQLTCVSLESAASCSSSNNSDSNTVASTELSLACSGVALRCAPGITQEELRDFKPFRVWLENTQKTIDQGLWQLGDRGIIIEHADRSEDSKIVCLKCNAHLVDCTTGEPLPGDFVLREDSVGILFILEAPDGLSIVLRRSPSASRVVRSIFSNPTSLPLVHLDEKGLLSGGEGEIIVNKLEQFYGLNLRGVCLSSMGIETGYYTNPTSSNQRVSFQVVRLVVPSLPPTDASMEVLKLRSFVKCGLWLQSDLNVHNAIILVSDLATKQRLPRALNLCAGYDLPSLVAMVSSLREALQATPSP